jgi:RimJ/RimL family protein N-acetyltransferase/catechol 2,3-dioxygenase-like lactoylglutathione lyase family enzyme
MTSVHHVTLSVADTARSAAWYQALLGPATVVERSGPGWTRLRLQWPDGLVIGVTAHDRTGTDSFDESRVGLDHVGLSCSTPQEVRGWHERLDALGMVHGPLEDVAYGWAVTARDPDGIPVEFFCARPPAANPGGDRLAGGGEVRIRDIDGDHPRPDAPSEYGDWGQMAQEMADLPIERWLIEVVDDLGVTTAVGDLSAHAVWYGPTPGSRAVNIGIGLAVEHRGRGIGSIAQRLLAEELHRRGVVRVEASTDVTNTAEQRALARAGFVLEGVQRGAQVRADGRHDLQVWSHVDPSA